MRGYFEVTAGLRISQFSCSPSISYYLERILDSGLLNQRESASVPTNKGRYLLIPENDIPCSEITGEMKLFTEEKCSFIIDDADLVYALVCRNVSSNKELRIPSVIKGMPGDSFTLNVSLMAG
jgi:hypothetical protein